MDRNGSSSERSGAYQSPASSEDLWSGVQDDLASERVTETVRRWLEGMESAIATARSARDT